jgi:Ca2+-binding EF-hand superfamily protein
MTGAAAVIVLALAAAPQQEPAPLATPRVAPRNLIFLAENRPVFVRVRAKSGDRQFEASWIDSVRALHATLDRNGDGKLTTKEADPKVLSALVRLATGVVAPVRAPTAAPVANPFGNLDAHPKDGIVSVEELAEAVGEVLGPFRLDVERQAINRTDALFDQLDRDKDGQLTKSELAAIAGSLRPLDLDDDAMISAQELEPYGAPSLADSVDGSAERRARSAILPPVVELVPGESAARPARILLKKYDKGKGDVPGRPDNKLSPGEFAIDPDAFAIADTNSDGSLVVEELRRFLDRGPIDLALDVSISTDPAGRTTVWVETVVAQPKGSRVRRLAEGDVELAIGQVRLEIHVDDGNAAAEAARRILEQQFKAADANKDGYLEGKEQAALSAPQSPLSGLSEVIDRDGDGKIYLKELLEFADRQQTAARKRLVVSTADQGRAIFGILDLDRDRRLGAREVMRTVERVMSWDSDGDGRVSADEIPYHFQVTIARGELIGLTGGGVPKSARRSMAASRADGVEVGPEWFQKMDRNRDGDISRREFLGTRDHFEHLDRDKDGLIDPDEARAAAGETKPKDSSKTGGQPKGSGE